MCDLVEGGLRGLFGVGWMGVLNWVLGAVGWDE